jgi:hypothetical protein
MIELSVNTPDVLPSDKQLQQAIQRALRKTTQYVKTHMQRRLGEQLAINQHALKNRVVTHVSRDKSGRASIWIGLNDLPAHRLGRVRQNRLGARVRNYQYRDAFVVRRGNQAVAFRRASSDHANDAEEIRDAYHVHLAQAERRGQRLPLNRVGLHIDVEGEAIAEALEPELQRAFHRFVDHEIHYLQGQLNA